MAGQRRREADRRSIVRAYVYPCSWKYRDWRGRKRYDASRQLTLHSVPPGFLGGLAERAEAACPAEARDSKGEAMFRSWLVVAAASSCMFFEFRGAWAQSTLIPVGF